jgi:hypothetical protein
MESRDFDFGACSCADKAGPARERPDSDYEDLLPFVLCLKASQGVI